MRAAHGGTRLPRLAEWLACAQMFFLCDRGDIRIAEDDEVGVVERVGVGVERELRREVVGLGVDMVDDAVDRECAVENGWAAGRWISAIVDGDTGPSTLTRGAQTVGAPDATGVRLKEGGLGVVVVDDFSAEDEEALPMYVFYPIRDRTAAIRSCLEVLDVGSGVEEVVVGGKMEVERV